MSIFIQLNLRNVLYVINRNLNRQAADTERIRDLQLVLFVSVSTTKEDGGYFNNVQNWYKWDKAGWHSGRKIRADCSLRYPPDVVENLCNAYEQAIANEKIDSLILIPTFICDFLCIHPFYDGNGRMSRLFALLQIDNDSGQQGHVFRPVWDMMPGQSGTVPRPSPIENYNESIF